MPFCEYCEYCNKKKYDKYGYVLCNQDGKYWFKLSEINNCTTYKPTNQSSIADKNDTEKGIKEYSKKKKLDYNKTYENLTSNKTCFITTTVCDILKYRDDTPTLVILRSLRDNYMISKVEYNELLLEYNAIGPTISSNLLNEANKTQIAQNLYQNYILPAARLALFKRYDEAIEIYIKMVDSLKDRYSLNDFEFDYNKNQQLDNKNDFKKALIKVYK